MHQVTLLVSYTSVCAALVCSGWALLTTGAQADSSPRPAISSTSSNVSQTDAPLPLQKRETLDLSTARPPVPLLRSVGYTYVVPTGAPEGIAANAATDRSSIGVGEAVAPDPAASGATREAAAKVMIEADGYKAVRIVGRHSDGRWRAMALRGTTEFAVLVDDSGSVSSQ